MTEQMYELWVEDELRLVGCSREEGERLALRIAEDTLMTTEVRPSSDGCMGCGKSSRRVRWGKPFCGADECFSACFPVADESDDPVLTISSAIARWQAKAAKAEGPADINFAEGGVRALQELRDEIERLSL